MGQERRAIITISRQFASGGRTIGKKLAERLGIPFYDRDLITLAAKKSGFAEEIIESADSKSTHSLLYSLSMGMYNNVGAFDGPNSLPLNDRIFLVQHNVIREIAQQGSCVIVGRCANYVLREDPDVINIFIHSDLDSRIRRAVDEYGTPQEKARGTILKNDKRRAAYFEYYTGARWGRMENYDLAIHSDRIGLDNAAALVESFAHMRADG